MPTTNRLHGYNVDRTFARTEERKVTRLNREEYLRSKEEHLKRENVELASEEEITNMAAEDKSISAHQKNQTGVCTNCYIRVKCCTCSSQCQQP